MKQAQKQMRKISAVLISFILILSLFCPSLVMASNGSLLTNETGAGLTEETPTGTEDAPEENDQEMIEDETDRSLEESEENIEEEENASEETAAIQEEETAAIQEEENASEETTAIQEEEDANGENTEEIQETPHQEETSFELNANQVIADTEETLTQIIDDTVNYYKKNKTNLTSWQEMVALWGAGADLTDGSWQLPEWKTKDPGLKESAAGTDHIRYIFGLLAMGEDPTHAWETDRNLYAELAAQQKEDGSIGGINKHIYAMLALHTGKKLNHFTLDKEKEQKALEFLLSKEISGGGFALSVSHPDTDITGMALLTLGIYQDQDAVQAAIERAKNVLKTKQLDNAGFNSDGPWGSGDNSNSLAASVSGLIAAGEDVLSDNWVENGQTVVDSFQRFQLEDGSFKWKEENPSRNLAATEQSLIALLDIGSETSTWYRIGEIQLPVEPKTAMLSVEKKTIGQGDIISAISVPIKDGDTAFTILKRVLDEKGLSLEYAGSGKTLYIQAIDGLAEFDHGHLSGWLYSVNGVSPGVSAGAYTVNEGDWIKFQYTTNLGEDLKEQESKHAQLSVEGIITTIFPEQKVEIKNEQTTALDLLKQALNKAEIKYDIVDTAWGPYLQAIDGQAAGSLGGWDGWMFKVNGEEPVVGASEYFIQENDEIQFYYSRWGAISSESVITVEAQDPTVTVSLVGDTFTEEAINQENWKIDAGTTGLELDSIEIAANQEAELHFTGTAKRGTVSVQALTGAIEGETPSDPIFIKVIQIVSGTENQVIEIADDETDVLIKSDEDEQEASNIVTLKFSKSTLPLIEAVRGNAKLVIPQNTVVITGDWNKLLQIPNNLNKNEQGLSSKINSKLDDKEVEEIFVRIKVGGDQQIEFDQHVTLTLKGMGDKEAGFIDQFGTFTHIPKFDDDTARDVQVYSYAQDADLIIKTKHFTEFLAYKAVLKEGPSEESPSNGSEGGSSGSSGGSPSKEKTVKLSVEKRSIGKGDILSTTSVTIKDGDTAFTILKRVADEKRISLEYSGSGKTLYVQAIDGLAEFDHGPLSGWMYSVNGDFLSESIGAYKVKDGDRIRFQYTTNLGEDIGNDYDSVEEENKGKTPSVGNGSGSGGKDNNDDITAKPTKMQEHIDSSANWILENGDFSIQDDFHDWNVFALARAGKKIPADYYDAIESYVKENNGDFRLVTDYERLALAVISLGKDPRNIAGYDFIEKIYQNERMTNQGTNGAVYALLALDAKNYEIPAEALWTREDLVNWILEQQNSDGGFPLSKASKSQSDMDITAMTLQALANYQDQQRVKEAIDKALSWISAQQLDNGGFKVMGEENSESISQVIIALSSLGIYLQDKRFVKEKGDLLTALLSFVNKDGGIAHLRNESSNYMATQQGLMAFTSYDRLLKETNGLFDLNDVKENNNKISFSDITKNTFGQEEIYRLVDAGVINGYQDGTFKPNQNLTRGQAANLFVRALQLEIPVVSNSFEDVYPNSLYFDAATATKAAGIFKGKNNGSIFGAGDVLTREQMASVLARAFNLQANEVEVKLSDLDRVSESHRRNVEILYQNGITTGRANGEFDPKAPVTRVQFVVFLVRAMDLAKND